MKKMTEKRGNITNKANSRFTFDIESNLSKSIDKITFLKQDLSEFEVYLNEKGKVFNLGKLKNINET